MDRISVLPPRDVHFVAKLGILDLASADQYNSHLLITGVRGRRHARNEGFSGSFRVSLSELLAAIFADVAQKNLRSIAPAFDEDWDRSADVNRGGALRGYNLAQVVVPIQYFVGALNPVRVESVFWQGGHSLNLSLLRF